MKFYIIITTLLASFSLPSWAYINVTDKDAIKLWNQIDYIGKMSNTSIIQTEINEEYISLGEIKCSFEESDACSIYVNTPTEIKMIAAEAGTGAFINLLVQLGVTYDLENSRMGVKAIECLKSKQFLTCFIDN